MDISFIFVLHIEAKTKWSSFCRQQFQIHFFNENERIQIWISLKFVPRSPIDNKPALVQIMAWRRPGGKPLSEPMMGRFPTHICVIRPQWVKSVTVTQMTQQLCDCTGQHLHISYWPRLIGMHSVCQYFAYQHRSINQGISTNPAAHQYAAACTKQVARCSQTVSQAHELFHNLNNASPWNWNVQYLIVTH